VNELLLAIAVQVMAAALVTLIARLARQSAQTA
jgi:hypothetical protein